MNPVLKRRVPALRFRPLPSATDQAGVQVTL